MEPTFIGIAIFLIVIVILVMLFFAFVARIEKVGPNEVLIISGGFLGRGSTASHKGFRLVKGGSSWYFPIVQKVDRLSLELLTLDVQPPAMLTKPGVAISVEGIAQIKIKGDDISIATAAEQFLSKTRDDIKQVALRSVEGHLRAILGTLTPEEVYSNREAFAEQVQGTTADDLAKMGLTIISFTIRQIHDEYGYLEALGKPKIAEVKKNATIGEAEAARDAEIRRNLAISDAAVKSSEYRRAAEAAKFEAEGSIAASKSQADATIGGAKYEADAKIASSERDYQIKQASFNAEVNKAKAESELAYDLQRYTTAQKVKEQELQVQVIEKEKQLEIQEQEIKRKTKELEATVTAPAAAERQRIQTLADAEKYQLEITAEGASSSVKLRGFADAEVEKAQAEARKVQGLIEAQIAEAQGKAEAEVLKAKGLADAEVILRRGQAEAEAMRLRGEAWKEYGEAAILQMLIERLPDFARAVAEPLSKIDKIVMINHGGGNGEAGHNGMASQITNEVTNIMTQIPPVLEALTGMSMQDLIDKLPGLKSATSDGAGAMVPTEAEAPKGKSPVVKSATPEPPLK